MRHTKIVSTLGPASQNLVAELVDAGVSIVRINCSHLSTDEVEAAVRSARAQSSRVGILVDIQGPKLRLINGIDATGDEVVLTQRGRIGLPSFATSFDVGFDPQSVGVKPGERILVNDGRIELVARETGPGWVRASVTKGGTAEGRRGVNLPDTDVRVEMYNDKDRADIAAACDAGADWIALSFIQRPDDVLTVRAMVPPHVRLLAKIERPQALSVLDDICAVSDAVMAARGDLGVEIDFARLPLVQRTIASAALRAGIASVCATEMLESMITGSRPTRAEVSDVTNAVRDGFDSVMLSAETAIGHDPIGTVRAMASILSEADAVDRVRSPFADSHPDTAAVAASTAALAARIKAKAILAVTYTGYNAELVSACRPPAPIIAATADSRVASRLMIRYGVTPVLSDRPMSTDEAIESAVISAKSAGLITTDDRIVVCLSRTSPRSDTDTIYVYNVT